MIDTFFLYKSACLLEGGRGGISLVPRLSRAHGKGKKESLVHTDCACSGFPQKSVDFVFFRNSSVHSTYKCVIINDVIDSYVYNGVSSVPSASSNASLKKTDLEG